MAKVMLALFVGLLRRRPTPMDGRPPETGEFERSRRRAASAASAARSSGERQPHEPPCSSPSSARRRLGVLGQKAQIIAVVGTVLFLALVIDLVRRRRLVERYALLWMGAAVVLVVLAVWNGALEAIADVFGIMSPPNALFLLGLGTVFILALHFSVAFSRLSEETKILAQEVARLDREQRRIRKGGFLTEPSSEDAPTGS